jgi:hypothetical protein
MLASPNCFSLSDALVFSRALVRIPPPGFLQRLLAACRRTQQKNDIDNIFYDNAFCGAQ